MKLTTICDISQVISYTRPSSPLFFWGHREEGLGTTGLDSRTKEASIHEVRSVQASIACEIQTQHQSTY